MVDDDLAGSGKARQAGGFGNGGRRRGFDRQRGARQQDRKSRSDCGAYQDQAPLFVGQAIIAGPC
jgi:hypothetical protein